MRSSSATAVVLDPVFFPEGVTPAKRRARKRGPADEQRNQLARQYMVALGIPCECRYLAKRHTRQGPRYDMGERLDRWQLTRALAGGSELQLLGVESSRCLVIDLDYRHDAERYKPVTTASPEAKRIPLQAEVRAVRKLRRAFPNVTWHAVSSKRGVHVVALLSESAAASELHALGQRILAAAGVTGPVEVFPTADGRTCRLPLTGVSRLLNRSLTGPKHRKRNDDLKALLDGRRASLADFAGAEPKPTAKATRTSRRAPSPSKRRASTQPLAVAPRELAQALRTQLSGRAFAETMVTLATHGIPRGAHFDACRKLAFTLASLGLTEEAAERAFVGFVERKIHAARHCQTAAGQSVLLLKFRTQWRHQQSSDNTPSANRRELRALPDMLTGRVTADGEVIDEPPAPESMTLSRKRSLAALKRWHPQHYPTLPKLEWRSRRIPGTCAHEHFLEVA